MANVFLIGKNKKERTRKRTKGAKEKYVYNVRKRTKNGLIDKSKLIYQLLKGNFVFQRAFKARLNSEYQLSEKYWRVE